MSNVSRQLARWQRLLVVEKVRRDKAVLRQRDVERQLEAARLEQRAVDHCRRDVVDSMTTASIQADLVLLRAGRSSLRQTRSTGKTADGRIHALIVKLNKCFSDVTRAQRIITVIDKRIDEYTTLVRREALLSS
jgi:hypothetical protein